MDYNPEIDKYTGVFTVPLGAINGTWEVSSVQFYDAVGNLYIENPNYSSPNYQRFTVINGSTDNIKPVVVSVKFDKNVAEPGNTINIVVDAYDADSGISSDKSKRIVGIKRVGANLTSTTYIKMDYNAEILLLQNMIIVLVAPMCSI